MTLLGMPNKVVAVYWTRWNSGIKLTDLPVKYNLIFLFAATRAASPAGGVVWGQNDIASDIRAVRGRGQRVVLSTGGAGQGISFSNRTMSTAFVDSVVRINSELGGTLSNPVIDGVDFNTFEAEALPNTPEYLWMFAELKRRFGSSFIISSPPAPWKQQDKDMIRQALAQGLMDFAAPQYYDGPGLAEPSYIISSVDDWVRNVAGGNASRIVVGYGMETTPNYSTIEQVTGSYRIIQQAHPGIRGAFLWQHRNDSNNGWVFANQMNTLIGAGQVVPPVIPPIPVPPSDKNVTIGGKTYPLAGTDKGRNTDELIVYTRTTGEATTTNIYGAEATVQGGRVVAIVDRQTSGAAGTPIPSDGYVLSGHGQARDWLLANAIVGATVSGDVPAPGPNPLIVKETATRAELARAHNALVRRLNLG